MGARDIRKCKSCINLLQWNILNGNFINNVTVFYLVGTEKNLSSNYGILPRDVQIDMLEY